MSYFEYLKFLDERVCVLTSHGVLEMFCDTNFITCFLDGEWLGVIPHENGEWETIQNGTNPIEDCWEDGCGNILSYAGW